MQVLGGHGFLSQAACLRISLICKGLVVENANDEKRGTHHKLCRANM